jgi:hypothetical protein
MTAQQIQPVLKNIETPIGNRVSSHNTPQKEALLRFIAEKIVVLKEDWDGYGGLPIEENVITNFKFLLNKLPNTLVNSIDTDCILPNSNGTLSIDWSKDSDGFFLEIGNYFSRYYIKQKGEIVKISDEFTLTQAAEFTQFKKDLTTVLNHQNSALEASFH